MISNSKEIAAFLASRKRRMELASIGYIVAGVVLLTWRATVFNPDAMLASWIFYLADIYGVLLGIGIIFCSQECRFRDIQPVKQDYTVDVFLPVYTEPVEMIEMTVIGAMSIRYPHRTLVLDDGRRPELKAIAEKHGAIYLTRADNRGAKAGNLNEALKFSDADMIAVFDADHIAQVETLDMMLGLMNDDMVGMVQAPQTYYNEDSFLYDNKLIGSGRWHDQAQFFDVIQSSRDGYDGCSGVGTGVVYRRSAVDKIGGFPEETLTEDLHISLLMHKHGLKSAHLNEAVAWGVAAADVPEYYKTRRRWAQGNLQAFVKENLLFCKGLPWRARVSYIVMVWCLLEGWQQLVYLLMPAYCMIFYVTPFEPGLTTTAIVLLSPFLMTLLIMQANGGYVRFVPSQVFSLGRMFVQMIASQGLLGRKLGWQVSLKNVLGRVSLGFLVPHFGILIFSFIALVLTMARVFGWVDSPYMNTATDRGIVIVAGGWVLFNVWRCWRWIDDTVRLTLRTHQEYLFEVELPILDEGGRWIATTVRLGTAMGDLGEIREMPLVGEAIRILVPGFTISATVTAVEEGGIFRFRCQTDELEGKLRRSLYSVDWHRNLWRAQHAETARRQSLGGHWKPVVLQSEGSRDFIWGVRLGAERRMILSGDHQVGRSYQIRFSRGLGDESTVVIGKKVPLDFGIPTDLNGQKCHVFEIDQA